MNIQLKCIFYIYFKYIYNLLLTYSYTVYMHIRNSIHVPPNHITYKICKNVHEKEDNRIKRQPTFIYTYRNTL